MLCTMEQCNLVADFHITDVGSRQLSLYITCVKSTPVFFSAPSSATQKVVAPIGTRAVVGIGLRLRHQLNVFDRYERMRENCDLRGGIYNSRQRSLDLRQACRPRAV